MAASIDLNTSSYIDETPKIRGGFAGGFLKRVKQAGESLRNTKREDLGWMAINMAVGAAVSKVGVAVAGLGLSATAGTLVTAGASAAITAGAAAAGLTASAAFVAAAASVSSIIVVGAASAVAGGVLSGTVRAVSGHVRERMKIEHETPRSLKEFLEQESKALFQIKDYKKQILKSTKWAVLGAGLMGAFQGASYLLENTEMGRELAGSAKDAFHKAAQQTAGHWSDFKKTLHAKLPFLTSAPAIDGVHKHIPKPMSVASAPVAPVPPAPPVTQAIPDSVPKPDVPDVKAPVSHAPHEHVSHENMPKPKVSVPTPPPASVAEIAPVAPAPVAVPDLKATIQAQALEEKLRYDYATSFGDPAPESMTTAEMAERLYPEDPKAYMASASDMAQDNLESGRSQFSADYKAINEAPAPAPEIAPAAPQAVPNTNTGIPVSNASPQELAAQAIAKAKLAVTQEELTNAYTMEHLRESVKNLTGTDAPVDATAEDLARQISPAHSDVIIKNLQAQAPQLKVENLAASCTTEIPKERSSVNVIKTLCYKFKEHMSGNDIAIVDNANEANPKNGLRLLYRKAVSAVSGLVQAQETNGFIAENISGPNGVVQEMTEARLGL